MRESLIKILLIMISKKLYFILLNSDESLLPHFTALHDNANFDSKVDEDSYIVSLYLNQWLVTL